MRIQLILPGLEIGGTEKMVFHLAESLQRSGNVVQVIALKNGGVYQDRLRGAGIPVQTLGTPDGFLGGLLDMPRLTAQLRNAIRTFRPDVIHSFLSRANIAVHLALPKDSVIRHIRSLRVMEREKRFHLWAECLTAGSATRYTVNSEALKQFALNRLGLAPAQITVIYNGIEPLRDVSAKEMEQLEQKLCLSGQRVLIAAGRLHRQKGFDLLLSAFSSIAANVPDATLLIAGEGPERKRLQRQIDSLRLSERARLVGRVEDLSPYLKRASAFILSSRWEGTPNAVLEAMAAGCPVIASKAGGVEEILSDGNEGLLFPAGDVSAMSRTIQTALDRNEETLVRSREARKRTDDFTMSRMAAEHQSLYRSLLPPSQK